MKRSLKLILLGILFTSVIAGALTVSLLRLLRSQNPGLATPQIQVVGADQTSSPTMVGTEHPVPVIQPSFVTAKPQVPSPSTTPAFQTPKVVANDLRDEVQSSQKSAREKAEAVRRKAEQLRSRVENLYQSHRISAAAYKKGQAEYRLELAKYEDQIALYRSGPTGIGGFDQD